MYSERNEDRNVFFSKKVVARLGIAGLAGAGALVIATQMRRHLGIKDTVIVESGALTPKVLQEIGKGIKTAAPEDVEGVVEKYIDEHEDPNAEPRGDVVHTYGTGQVEYPLPPQKDGRQIWKWGSHFIDRWHHS